MSISGIVVGVVPDQLDEVAAALAALDGVDVHHLDPSSARIVVTQESASDAEQEDGLLRIQKLPHVRYAQLVYYAVDDAPEEEESE